MEFACVNYDIHICVSQNRRVVSSVENVNINIDMGGEFVLWSYITPYP